MLDHLAADVGHGDFCSSPVRRTPRAHKFELHASLTKRLECGCEPTCTQNGVAYTILWIVHEMQDERCDALGKTDSWSVRVC